MADIIPFRGTRYDPAIVGEIGKAISPPYDVIDETMRDMLFDLSEHNIARIIKADKAEVGDPYASAGALWRSWREQGAVRRDQAPSIYVYEQNFETHGHKFSRTGMIGLVKLESLGNGVLPHEKTLSAPRADRLELLRATETNLGLVFALYPDAENHIDALLEQAKTDAPIIQVPDRDNQLHRLWAITDSDALNDIRETMLGRELLIADGHHRYETALAYSREHPDWEAARYRMMALVNTANVGLVVLPTHRLVKNLPNFNREAFFAGLRRRFDIHPYPGESQAVRAAVFDIIRNHQNKGRHAFGLCMGDGKHYVLVLRSLPAMVDVTDHSEEWRQLDVAILHHCILENVMGITPEQVEQQIHVEYVQDFTHTIKEAAERVRAGSCQAFFLLNPTRIDEVIAVARRHERMPQKSTFFYPKVYSGLVHYCLEDFQEA